MSALQLFTSNEWSIRIVLVDGEPWFVAADVCSALGLANVTMALRALDDDGVNTTEVIDSMGRKQQARIVSEPALYVLIFQSRRPEAKEFRRWVTTEVLPAIRKTGSYTSTPAIMPSHAEALRGWADTLERVAALEPSAAAWDHMVSDEGDYSVADAAKILARDPNITTGRDRLFVTLIVLGWVYRPGSDKGRGIRGGAPRAYQRAVEAGRLAERARDRESHTTGERIVAIPQVRVTLKGLSYLHKHLGGSAPLELN